VLIGDINDSFGVSAPLADPDASELETANALIGGALNLLQLPMVLSNDALALATNSISEALPSLPAATLGALHLGIPHLHLHPPALPIPLPSFGPVLLSGSVSVLIHGLPAARAGDIGFSLLCGSFCPMFEVFTGSSKVFVTGQRAARMFDLTLHCTPGGPIVKAGMTMAKAGAAAMGGFSIASEVLDA